MHSFAAYLCLVLSFFVAFGQALPIPQQSTRNVTLGFNSSDVHFSPDWEIVSSMPTSSAPPFTFSDNIGASFGVLLPNRTVAVEYIGLPRSAGAAYAVCIDCDLVNVTKGSWSLVDGNRPGIVDENQAAPIVLFSIVDLDPTVIHTITVTNIPDTRFNNTSQITFHSLNITIADNNGDAQPTGSSTGTTEPTGTSAPTESASDSAEPTSTSDSAKPTSTSDSAEPTSTSNSVSDSAEPTSTSNSKSATETSTTEPTESASASESFSSAPSSSPSAAVHVQVSPTSSASPTPADSTAPTKTQTVSKPLIAVLVIICVLILFCLAVALIFVYRSRRQRAAAMIHDAESQAYGNSQWLPHDQALTGMQEVPLSATPPRPRNPFEDRFPPDVPLELETPGDSTLMNKRGIGRPRSSFGNGLHYYSARR